MVKEPKEVEWQAEQEGTATLVPPDKAECEKFPPPNVILPKRTTIIMEPLTILFCIAFQGLGPLISQYVYYRIGREMGLHTGNQTASGSAVHCNASDRYNGGGSNSSSLYALTEQVQDRTSTLILYRDVASAATASIAIPLLSSASDRVGRRVAIILPCAGSLAESLVTLSVIYFDLPLVCILVAAAASGLCGGIGCLFAGALAYLADITPLKSRPMRITVLEALTGLGGAAVCVLIGWWIRLQGYLIPHLFCTLVFAAAALFCVFLVPEVRRPLPLAENGAGVISSACRVFTEPVRGMASLMTRAHGFPAVYALVLAGVFLYCASFYGTMNINILYSMNYPFCLDSVYIGYVTAAKQLVFQIGMMLIVWLLHPTLSTLTIASLGLISTAVGNVLLALAWDKTLLWVSIGATLIAGCPVPMYRAFLSAVTPSDKQGCMFSAFGVLQMVSYLVGSVAFTNGYNSTLLWSPGFVFYTVAAALVAGLLLTVVAELQYRLRTLPSLAAAAAAIADLPGAGSVQYEGGSRVVEEF